MNIDFTKENKTSMLSKIKNLYNKYASFFDKKYFLHNYFLAFIAIIIIEAFNRRSVVESFKFIVVHFDLFVMNFMIVFGTISISVITNKRRYWKYFAFCCWIILGVVNYIMYVVRLVPFTFNDILLIPSTITVIPVYLSLLQIILIVLGLILLLVFVIYMYIKSKKYTFNIKKNLSILSVLILICVFSVFIGEYLGYTDSSVHGLINKLDKNGFSYCFANSLVNRGMVEPDNYSSDNIENITNDIVSDNNKKAEDINIVFLQLESFFDPKTIHNVSYDNNPVPFFDSLSESCSHGTLLVPSFGAGTANTEFEVITGMNLDFFGIGEVPYRTVCEEQTIDSMCYAFKNYGYTTHAIHNNDATFYNRNLVFQKLGFDTFTSLEYMYNVEYNYTGWAKDEVLISSIDECIKTTSSRDMVYTIGVQPHGVYPDTYPDNLKTIDASGFEYIDSEESFEYFLSQLHEDDIFLKNLVEYFSDYDEPVAFVIFGDHLPAFRFEDYMFSGKNKYLTEYVIWTNFEFENISQDLSTYQLYSYVFDRLGFEGNTISDLHSDYNYDYNNDEYFSNLEMIQYDILEGENYSNDSFTPVTSNATLGVRNIHINSVMYDKNILTIKGNNFNEFSKVFIDEKKYDTEYININELRVYCDDIDSDINVVVGQVDKMGRLLSETKSFKFIYNTINN